MNPSIEYRDFNVQRESYTGVNSQDMAVSICISERDKDEL